MPAYKSSIPDKQKMFEMEWQRLLSNEENGFLGKLQEFADDFVEAWRFGRGDATQYLHKFMHSVFEVSSLVNILLMIKKEAARTGKKRAFNAEWLHKTSSDGKILSEKLLQFLEKDTKQFREELCGEDMELNHRFGIRVLTTIETLTTR